MKPAKLPQHRRELQGLPPQPPVLPDDERVQPHVVIDDPHHRTGPAPGECVQVRLQHRPGGGDGHLAAPARTAVGDQAVRGVFEMPRPIHEMDPQAVRAFAFDEAPQRLAGRPAAAVLQDQDVEARQAGVPGEPAKIGKQAAHVFESRRVGDHPDDQVGRCLWWCRRRWRRRVVRRLRRRRRSRYRQIRRRS